MMSFYKTPDWNVLGADWPHRDHSDFVEAGDYCWHVQRFGAGPLLLMLHGTGASAHSWAPLASRLHDQFEIFAVDLPGHGFTAGHRRLTPTLPYVAGEVDTLLETLGIEPAIIAGHSAGAAIAVEMVRRGRVRPRGLVCINGAFEPFEGAAGFLFPVIAKLLYFNPLTAYAIARSAGDRKRVLKLIEQTGSSVPEQMTDCYAALLRQPAHVAGALGLMAHWDLSDMGAALAALDMPALFLAGEKDGAVPARTSEMAAELAPQATLKTLESLGHLLHEEAPAETAEIIADFARKIGVI
ncbi:MAG: alpha/beta fold hydrolase BchO [Pseudomonadota bacterium]